MSAVTKEQICQAKCPCEEVCPINTTMGIIGGKWKLQILCSVLQDGPTRYNDLKRKMKSITNTMLSGSLKELERDGLVIRKQYHEMPVRVEYTATDSARELMPIIGELLQWTMSR